MANKTDLKAGGAFYYLHNGNHTHGNLINTNPSDQIVSAGNTSLQWIKLMTLTSTETQYQPYWAGEIELLGGNIGIPYAQYAKVLLTFRVKNIRATDPSTAPILNQSVNGSSTLPSGTYFVTYTWVTANGESKASPEASFTLATGNELDVTIPALPSNVTSANVYISSTSGIETKQGNTNTTTFIRSTPLSAGTALPTVNTAMGLEATMTYDSNKFNAIFPSDFVIVLTQCDTTSGQATSAFVNAEIWYKNHYAWDDLAYRLNWERNYRMGKVFDGKTMSATQPVSSVSVPLTVSTRDTAVPPNTTTNPTYQNGWVTNGATGSLKLTKTPTGAVVMQGTLSNPTLSNWTTAGIVIANLGSGYYNPNNTLIFGADVYTTSFGISRAICKISTTGDLKIDKYLENGVAPTTVPQYIMFNGISFMNV